MAQKTFTPYHGSPPRSNLLERGGVLARGTGFTLEILTPQRRVFHGKVISLVAPGVLGYLGILANHAPLVTTLTPGKVTCRGEEGAPTLLQSTAGGILEVCHNSVTLLAEEIG